MAKIVLGQQPKNFSYTVTFAMLDGSAGGMEVSGIYRTRTEFGQFADGIRAGARKAAEADLARVKELAAKGQPIPELTQQELLARENAINVGYVMGCIDGWNLDVPFDQAAVEQLADEVPAAVSAIIAGYRDAITEGRLGN